MNGTTVKRVKDTIFIPLPREQWRSAGTCNCPVCKGREVFWDTLAVSKNPPKGHGADYAWTVHYPELHPARAKGKFIRQSNRVRIWKWGLR